MFTNAQLAELFAIQAEEETGHRQRAFRRASRAALMWWPEEMEVHLASGAKLTELSSIGPWIARLLNEWLEELPEAPETPRLRSDFISFAEARAIVDENADFARGLRGDLQMHSTYSDGTVSIEEMARAAEALGYEYIPITDHSKGLKIAGGIDEETLAAQGEEIERLNEDLAQSESGLRVLKAIELNLDLEGEGDMEPESLIDLDLVLGSFHSQLRRKEDQTERYLAAVRNPHVNVLAHPRGRMYNKRVGLSADWPTVFAEAARCETAIEVNAYPDRQDLSTEVLKVARDAGVRISIGTDSHHPEELRFVTVGLAHVLRAGIDPELILNLMPRDELVAWARGTRITA